MHRVGEYYWRQDIFDKINGWCRINAKNEKTNKQHSCIQFNIFVYYYSVRAVLFPCTKFKHHRHQNADPRHLNEPAYTLSGLCNKIKFDSFCRKGNSFYAHVDRIMWTVSALKSFKKSHKDQSKIIVEIILTNNEPLSFVFKHKDFFISSTFFQLTNYLHCIADWLNYSANLQIIGI